MHGEDHLDVAPVYGTKGLFSPLNQPGSRSKPATWTDKEGNLWLFGGTSSTNPSGYQNDLWKYNPTLNQWAWIGGPNITNGPGVYGEKNISSCSFIPCSRVYATCWTDADGNFWLFGGEGMIKDFNSGTSRNDLWKYDPKKNEWTWVNGDMEPGRPYPSGSYGTKGKADDSNRPPCRYGGAGWVDAKGDFWLMGGYGFMGWMNDLWKYHIATNEWTWMGGDQQGFQPGVYGTKGVPSPNNKPGGRTGAATWTDAGGDLWLFGGYSGSTVFNDLWRYQPATNEWTWMDGSNVPDQISVYGSKGVAAPANKPGSRADAICWTDQSGNFWLYGRCSDFSGVYKAYSDLWKYDLQTKQWTWVGGDNVPDQEAVYGTKGNAAPANNPGKRTAGASWTDGKGNLWLYGGFIFKLNVKPFFGDLWKYSLFPEINTLPLEKNSYCAGDWVSVPYSVSEPFRESNVFSLELSDAEGSFDKPIEVSSLVAADDGKIMVRLSSAIPPGNHYRFRVVSRNPVIIGSDNGSDITIGVKPSLSIDADAVHPVCPGTPVKLSARVNDGGSYLFNWSDNSISPSIVVHPVADSVFFVRITEAVCGNVEQSIRVAVLQPQNADLGQDASICEGQQVQLKPSTVFKEYLWQNGSTNATFWVDAPGVYSVQVKDACGLISKDTIQVIAAARPASFLFQDTAMCSGDDRFLLKASGLFSSFLWSTGEQSAQINIRQPGTYWLKVTDANGCVGEDTVVVEQKECTRGLFFPNAFTPNGDGHNDTFKPIVRSTLKAYEFSVYNRWGEVVFKTSKVGEGWAGSRYNRPFDSGVFTWICHYQMEGTEKRTEKGTVILIR